MSGAAPPLAFEPRVLTPSAMPVGCSQPEHWHATVHDTQAGTATGSGAGATASASATEYTRGACQWDGERAHWHCRHWQWRSSPSPASHAPESESPAVQVLPSPSHRPSTCPASRPGRPRARPAGRAVHVPAGPAHCQGTLAEATATGSRLATFGKLARGSGATVPVTRNKLPFELPLSAPELTKCPHQSGRHD